MKGTFKKKALGKVALLSSTTLLLGLAGTAFAYTQAHDSIVLKNPAGAPITEMNAPGNAFSMKKTCFGTAGCHGDQGDQNSKLKFTYDDIEKHSYHAQIGSNEQKGFNPWNPDATMTEFVAGVPTGNQIADPWRRGVGPKGKNWVQSPGHVGSW